MQKTKVAVFGLLWNKEPKMNSNQQRSLALATISGLALTAVASPASANSVQPMTDREGTSSSLLSMRTAPSASTSQSQESSAPALALDGDLAPTKTEDKPITTTQKAVRYTTLAIVPIAVTAYGQQIWNWGESGGWTWGNEGFFGGDLGGADKMGHAWGCYALTRASYAIFDYTENGDQRKLWYSATMAALIGTGIEVGDAYNGAYGFSWEDIVADYTGIAMAVVAETVPEVDALVNFNVTYWPTQGFVNEDSKSILEFEGDSSGWTYLLSLKLAGLKTVGINVPRPLEYLMLDVGYYTRGYSRFDEEDYAVDETSRNMLIGVSLNVPEVFDALFTTAGVREHWSRKVVSKPFDYFHLPIGLSYDSNLDG